MRNVGQWVLALFVAVSFAQQEPTPYELIRPTWPEIWNPSVYQGITVSKGKIPTESVHPSYAPNVVIPDTTPQPYLDAMNAQISPIRVNQAGYREVDANKYFYYIGSSTTFDVIRVSDGSVVGSGTIGNAVGSAASSISIRASNNAMITPGGDTRYTIAGTGPAGSMKEGKLPAGLPTNERLRLKMGSDLSADFIISDQVYGMVKDAVLKFYGIQRSGNSENWFHKPSHLKDGLQGGWYDCGDHLKEPITNSYALAMVAMMAAIFPDRDTDKYGFNHNNTVNTDGIPDMLREAKFGADFILTAYKNNGYQVNGNLVTGVGNFGADHTWWGSPEYQDGVPAGRGGPVRPLRLEQGSNVLGKYAAGLAFFGKLWSQYDTAYANLAIRAAKDFYADGKASLTSSTSPAYTVDGFNDDMAWAALGLFYATKEKPYLEDLAYSKTAPLGTNGSTYFKLGNFYGGWFARLNPSFTNEGNGTSWSRSETASLYGFYKLILQTKELASSYGISAAQRDTLAEDVAYNLAGTIAQTSLTGLTITIPKADVLFTNNNDFATTSPWFTMKTYSDWIWNRYQMGNIWDVMAYADVTKDLENVNLPQGGAKQWKAAELRERATRQLDFMLGVNPWDISMIYGVGDKNFAHPHHRAANPEGRNTPGANYIYRPPVGALQGGYTPGGTSAFAEHYDDYTHTETCIDAAATTIGPLVMLAKDEDLNGAPVISVQIEYVGYDKAILTIKQNRYGTATVEYGTSEATLSNSKASDSASVNHRIELTGLNAGTTYFFKVTAENDRSGNATTKYKVDSTLTPYDFTTLNSPPAAADIQNIKVCNVSADSAEIMWYTPNGEYDSQIYWDTVLTDYANMKFKNNGIDASGFPTKFHRVKIGGLKEKTKYYYVVESNGARKAVDLDGLPLEFTTPVTQMDFNVRVSRYTWSGMTALTFNIENNEAVAFDSLELRVYLRDKDGLDKDVAVRFDICQAYDESGYNLPCEDLTIGAQAKALRPVKMEDTYDAATQTWAWYITLPLGYTKVKAGSRVRYDVMLDRRSPWAPYEDLMNQPSAHIPSNSDWSFGTHSRAAGDPADYAGIPVEDKDIMDNMASNVPINPFVTVYRKNEFISGYSPSYSEMSTKRANYEMTVTYEAPFNVPNGTYLDLDAGSSTFFAKGHATITENGSVTDIWVNGSKVALTPEIASYDLDSNHWDLNIPVKMAIGGNTVDITVFAGPDNSCETCQENGGCAFDNRNYYINFSKGKLSASSLTITDTNTGNAVVSPATPGQTIFHIQVRDADKLPNKVPTLSVYVINVRKKDTTTVELKLVGDKYVSSTPVTAVAKDPSSTTGNEIAFFGGDTILVQYVDPEDAEDVSYQTFFAEPTSPSLVSATAKDSNCDNIMDAIDLVFSQAFDDGDKMDSLWVSIKDPITQASDSFFVTNEKPIAKLSTISISIPPRATIPRTGSPRGLLTAYIMPNGAKYRELSSVSITDGMYPQLIGVSLLENPEPRSTQDTIKVSFNEPIILANKKTWPLAILNGSNSVSTTGITIVGEATTEDNGRSWLYVVEGNTNGTVIDSGFTTSVLPTFTIMDLGGNRLDPAGPCATPVPIVEVPKPVPVDLAEMRDQDGDGSADQLYLEFARKLRTKDMLDSFVVKWGSPVQLKSFAPEQPRQWTLGMKFGSHMEGKYDENGDHMLDADSTPILVEVADTMSTLTIDFKDSTFAYGTTHGYLSGKGGVIPRLGPEGGFFDREYIVNDAVGPVIVTARKGKNLGNLDSLAIVISEPVDTLDADFMIERRRGAEVVGVIPMRVVRASDSLYVFLYTSDAIGAVRIGDYVRLVSTKPGVVDKSGNEPGVNNPWVEVKGSLENTVNYDITMQVPVSGGKTRKEIAKGYPVDPPKESEYIRVTVVDPRTGNEVKLGGGSGSIITQPTSVYDTTEYKHLGPTFLVNVQLPGALIQQGGKDAWNYLIKLQLNIFDNLGQFVNHLQMQVDLDKLGRDYLNPDGSLSLRLEWMVHDNSAPKSQTGRIVSTGAYVGVFQFNSTATALVDDEAKYNDQGVITAPPSFRKGQVVKSSQTKRKTFGVMRAK